MMRHEDEIKQGITTTLDEPVRETILRDLRQVADKLKVVLLPLGAGSQENVLQKLREWDLWGPLLVCLLLSSVLSLSAPGDSASLVFAAVFVIVWAGTDSRYWAAHESPLALTPPTSSSPHAPQGAAAVTLNAQLLGGTISFFQVRRAVTPAPPPFVHPSSHPSLRPRPLRSPSASSATASSPSRSPPSPASS